MLCMAMRCPHCGIHFHANWDAYSFYRHQRPIGDWTYSTADCPECRSITLSVSGIDTAKEVFRQIYPLGANRRPVPKEVPSHIAADYIEACNVLSISARASAALSRRCLQNMLYREGYKDRGLAKEIDLLLNETDRQKILPLSIRATVDAIRNFGNFSAHPIDDKTTLQIIDVEPEEAEWCLEIIEELFEHFYVEPERAKAKKAALDAKLAAAGKPLPKP